MRTTTKALFAAAMLLAAGVVRAQAGGGEDANRKLISNAFDRWRDGTQSIFDLLADDARWTIVGSSEVAGTYENREAFMARVIRPFGARMRDPLKPEVRKLYADGDTVVVLFDGRAVARDGVPYVNTYTWYMRVADGRVVDVVAFFDPKAFDALWSRVEPAKNP
ncbi:nuclear transport factor 2 family protein [Lysobacter sp. A6]|uniref:Nuclear transport factor 2 family protein n=1 Tax=Noviluteimonas lactosilytica TaxID=2888523 RepID=A0ABS8JGE7_9GAMM|nr:nuclear transport factor 2 family protein [Lysobacter lactosilyticus]MCC8362666.1 nuclear transport factor 2 family protein [Lysobacter lactosilyticus]